MEWELRTWTERVGPLDIVLEGIADFDAACGTLARRASDPAIKVRYQALCPMFGVIWPAARGLARRVVETPMAGARVLEVGCGLALPSLAAAMVGAEVIATDQHPDTAEFLTRNLRHNRATARYASFDWEGPLPEGVPERSFDFVISSDVLYTDEMPVPVARAYDRFLGPDGVGWLTDPGRPWLVEFVAACRDLGFEVEDDVVAGADGRDEVFLFTLRRPRP